MPRSDRAGGFTLLEMLVVLLISGMALLLASQALGQYQRAHTRAIASEQGGREYRLSVAWFHDSVRGLYPIADEELDKERVFSGTADGFSGYTLSPVLAARGTPVFQDWRILSEGGAAPRMELQEEGESLVLSLPRAASMRLHYMDSRGELHDQWPPRLGTPSQLPAAVLLELVPLQDGTGGALIAGAVLGPRDPLSPLERAYEYEPL